jgi:uncharacterized membrane protein
MKTMFDWRFASVVALALVSVMLLPQQVSAQPRRDLTLTLVPDAYYVQARAGRAMQLVLEVRNSGATRLTQITMSAVGPEGWTVVLDSIEIGRAVKVDVNLRPPATVATGEYPVSFAAVSGDVRSDRGVQVRVAPASYWLWVGLGVAVAVIATFSVIFLRMGRRG